MRATLRINGDSWELRVVGESEIPCRNPPGSHLGPTGSLVTETDGEHWEFDRRAAALNFAKRKGIGIVEGEP